MPPRPVDDPSPASRILATPTFSSNKTSALLGQMIDGVIYDINAEVDTIRQSGAVGCGDALCTSAQARTMST